MSICQQASDQSDLPALYTSTDKTASNAKRAHTRYHLWAHILLAIGAVAGAMPAKFAAGPTWLSSAPAAISTIALVSGFVLALHASKDTSSGRWYAARAAAERVKSMTWKYMMLAEPYHEADADLRFIDHVSGLIDTNSRTGVVAPTTDTQITPRMQEIRGLPPAERSQHYLTNRAEEQQKWYNRRTKEHECALKYLRISTLSANLIAVVVSIFALVYGSGLAYVGILTTMASSSMSWTLLRRDAELSNRYAHASQALAAARSALPDTQTEASLQRLVKRCESIFADEHAEWLARGDAS